MRNQLLIITTLFAFSCADQSNDELVTDTGVNAEVIAASFGDNIDLENLFNYEGQTIPSYVNKDNTGNNGNGRLHFLEYVAVLARGRALDLATAARNRETKSKHAWHWTPP